MPAYVVRRLIVALNRRGLAVRDRRILLVGLSYEKNTGDPRESPSRAVAKAASEPGSHGPCHRPSRRGPPRHGGRQSVSLTAEEIAAADAILLLVDHDDIDYDVVTANASYVLDCRHRVAGLNVEYL